MADKPFQSQLTKAEQEISEIFDGTHLIGFRDDIEAIWTENRENKSWDIDSRKTALQVTDSLQNSRKQILTIENGVNKLQIFDGLTGGALGAGLYFLLKYLGVNSTPAVIPSIVVFLLFTLINHGLLFTKALINLTCYTSASPREEDATLLFKRGWNAKVLSSNSSILGILIVAMFRRIWTDGYETGLNFLQRGDMKKNILEEDVSFLDLI